MNDEFNRQIYTTNSQREVANYREFADYKENSAVKEIGEAAKFDSKRKGGGKPFSSLAAAMAALVFTVLIVPALITGSEITVTFTELAATDRAISYAVFLQNRGEERLELVVYNDFTQRRAIIEGYEAAGEISGLQPDMNYFIAVRCGNKVFAKTQLRTAKHQKEPVTVFRSVRYESTREADGMFRFQMDFSDENGFWYNFGAAIIDEYGTVAECEFSEDLHGEQTIPLAGITGATANFIIMCSSYENNEAELTLYRATVRL